MPVTALPTEKTPKSLSAATAKVLLYGPPKVGKTTLCAELYPDTTLFLRCEPGQGGVEHYGVDISSWQDFNDVYNLLAKGDHGRSTVIIDTVDELARMCEAHTNQQLGITHPSDLGYGKGWQAVSDRFRLGVGALAGLGLGVWFISHSKDEKIEERMGTRTKVMPALKGNARDFIIGFVDHIFYATIEQTEDGQVRQLRTAASENYEAGSREPYIEALDPVPLRADVVRDLLALEVLGVEASA